MLLKLESMHADLGVENVLTSILARVQQLVGKEGDLLVDRKTHIYNLQRKIKSLKEQLDSKELHMDLLRKKVLYHYLSDAILIHICFVFRLLIGWRHMH